jgi:hypothetical protein
MDVQDWVYDMMDANHLEISMRLESQSQLNSKYLLFVSLQGVSRDPGKDVRIAYASANLAIVSTLFSAMETPAQKGE